MEDQPVLHRHLHWVWQAFTDLNYRRGATGFGSAVPITYSDILAYCQLKGIYLITERERLCKFLDTLDRHWMTSHYEKQKNKQEGDSSPPPKAPRKPKPTSPRRPPRKPVS